MQKFFKKYFLIIFIFFFFSIFSFFEGWEYIELYKKSQILDQEKQLLSDWIDNFSLDKIKILEEVEFYYSPSKNLLEEIIKKIDASENRVYLEIYMLTKDSIKDALIRAENRGLDVKVLLEKNPYMAYNINNKSYDFLDKAWVFTQWSNAQNFALNHTKMLIVDDDIIISTWNFTHSTFTYNRDFFLFIKDEILLYKLLDIFNGDFDWELVQIYDDNLVISPEYSRSKFEILFREAEKSIDMYFQYLKDEELFNLLISRLENGIKINIILAESALDDNKSEIEKLKELGANVSLIKKPKIHSKAILVDDKYLFLGSINFSWYSLDKNREIWIILKDKKVIEKFKNIFKEDIRD